MAAQPARDVSPEAHRHAFTTWYASAPGLAPVARLLYEQLRSPDHWAPSADTEAVLARPTGAGVPLGVVRDVGWDLRATFARHGLGHHFGPWVHSHEHRRRNPARASSASPAANSGRTRRSP
ncbi:hypothetical protein [Streptomyces sp. NPDC058374]|uniref:hypothetical protein n=1 Tax=unclassified Streptomyces TaxID=2593676 RepID=UPI003667E6D2